MPPEVFGFEPPDLVVARWRGRVEPGDVERFLRRLRRADGVPLEPLVLCEVTAVTALAERRRIAAHVRDLRVEVRAVAFVGARFGVRALATVLLRVAGMGSRDPRAAFFDHEEEARRWLASRRAEPPAGRADRDPLARGPRPGP